MENNSGQCNEAYYEKVYLNSMDIKKQDVESSNNINTDTIVNSLKKKHKIPLNQDFNEYHHNQYMKAKKRTDLDR